SIDGDLKRLLLADSFVRYAEGVPRLFVVLYIVDALGFSVLDYGLLITIQRLTNLAVYLPLAKLSDRLNRRPFVLLTFAFFALFPLILSGVSTYAGLAVAFAVAGLWELGEPARKAMIVDLSEEHVRGRVIGLYYLVRNLAVFPASLV